MARTRRQRFKKREYFWKSLSSLWRCSYYSYSEWCFIGILYRLNKSSDSGKFAPAELGAFILGTNSQLFCRIRLVIVDFHCDNRIESSFLPPDTLIFFYYFFCVRGGENYLRTSLVHRIAVLNTNRIILYKLIALIIPKPSLAQKKGRLGYFKKFAFTRR